MLRPGGRVGTVTWASQLAGRAQVVWNHALAEAGVPLLPPRRADAGLDHPEALDALLRTAGLAPRGIWVERLHRQWDPASFWALVTGSGASRQRLGLIDPGARSVLLAGLRTQLNELAPEDYLWEGEVICAVGSKPGTPGASLRWQPARSSATGAGTTSKGPTARALPVLTARSVGD